MGAVRVSRPNEQRLVVRVSGHLDETLGKALQAALGEGLSGEVREVVVDFTQLDGYDILGRPELAAAHRLIASSGCRSAYVADRSRIRGLALMAIREVDDRRARPVMNEAQAEAWFEEAGDDFESALRRVERGERALGGGTEK